MRVVLSLGGSVLVPEPGMNRVEEYAGVIGRLREEDVGIGTVVGGGGVARDYIEAARAHGANEIELDYVGIDVTRLNARLLIAAIEDPVVAQPPTDYPTAAEAMQAGETVVMGGVVPAQTTDAVSAALAEYVDADRLVYATSVDGVYDKDPATEDDATRFDQLTAGELVSHIAELEMTAGASAPVDVLAAKVIQRSGIETLVLDGTDPDGVERAIRSGEFEGTAVVPDGAQ
ncbi:MAG: UMP kinase [Halobacteriales archaeon]|nr:UMP kinase [Halobacteriales archaeon]